MGGKLAVRAEGYESRDTRRRWQRRRGIAEAIEKVSISHGPGGLAIARQASNCGRTRIGRAYKDMSVDDRGTDGCRLTGILVLHPCRCRESLRWSR